MFVNELQEALPPPNHRRGLVAWIRQNLFPNWWNGLLTLMLAYLLLPLLWSALDWAIFSANWQGSSRADCAQGGACWVFIESRLGQYLYGFYPADQYWRINLAFAGLAVLLALLIWPRTPRKGWLALFTLLVFPVIAFVLIHGGAGLEVVETNRWGGLMLTLVLAVVGIVVALPFGILLALGRRSHMPVISSLSTVYIEFWRAVPLHVCHLWIVVSNCMPGSPQTCVPSPILRRSARASFFSHGLPSVTRTVVHSRPFTAASMNSSLTRTVRFSFWYMTEP